MGASKGSCFEKTRRRAVVQLGQVLDGVLHLEHPEGAARVVEQGLEQRAVLHLAAVGAPAVEDVVVVPHHHRGHARERGGGVQRGRGGRPGLALLGQPALLVEAEVVGLDLLVERGRHLERQLLRARQRHPVAQRLQLFPDGVEVDLVAAHEQHVEALQLAVVDAALVPELLLVEQLGRAAFVAGRAQRAVVAEQQVFPHGVGGAHELAHHRRVGEAVAGHIGQARRVALGGHGEGPAGAVGDAVGQLALVLEQPGAQVVAQVALAFVQQQLLGRWAWLAVQQHLRDGRGLLEADEGADFPLAFGAQAAEGQDGAEQQVFGVHGGLLDRMEQARSMNPSQGAGPGAHGRLGEVPRHASAA
jgi:hypothetical protein